MAELHAKQPEAEIFLRSSTRLQSRWAVLQNAVQKYLAFERVILLHPPSGMNVLDVRGQIMQLCRKRTRKKGKDGKWRDGSAFRSLGAVSVLKNCPKSGSATDNVNSDTSCISDMLESSTGIHAEENVQCAHSHERKAEEAREKTTGMAHIGSAHSRLLAVKKLR